MKSRTGHCMSWNEFYMTYNNEGVMKMKKIESNHDLWLGIIIKMLINSRLQRHLFMEPVLEKVFCFPKERGKFSDG